MELRTPVGKTSTIGKVGFIEDEETLVVLFKDGHTYEYYDVPKAIYHEILFGNEPGKILKNKVKGQYQHEKMN